jgi:hypothetical protein
MAMKRFFQDVEAAMEERDQEMKRLKTDSGFTRVWINIYYQVKDWWRNATLRVPL